MAVAFRGTVALCIRTVTIASIGGWRRVLRAEHCRSRRRESALYYGGRAGVEATRNGVLVGWGVIHEDSRTAERVAIEGIVAFA
jgi:hypothetical protein